MIGEAEKLMDVRLPALLVELLTLQNGGYTSGYAFPMSRRTSWADDHVPFLELFGIVTDRDILTAQNVLDSNYLAQEWGLPEKQVLLAGDDGHWWITLDYRHGPVPKVRWIDVECGDDILIAGSFEEFINGLLPVDEFVQE